MAEDPVKFKPITDNAKKDTDILPNPKVLKTKHVKEHAWLIEYKVWQALYDVIPKKQRDDLKVPIGGPQGWIELVARHVLAKGFDSVPHPSVKKPNDGKNCHGLLTFGGAYLIWRHCTHDRHKLDGPPTGTYDAFEVYQIYGDQVGKAALS